MRIKEGFVLRQVASQWVVLPVGQASVSFNGMLSLNAPGVLLWKAMENGCSTREALTEVLLDAYEVEREQAMSDVDEFLATLMRTGCIEE